MKESLVKAITELFRLTILPPRHGNEQKSILTKGEEALLGALGLDFQDEDILSQQINELRLHHWSTMVDPVWVGQENEIIHVPLRLNIASRTDMLHWNVTEENHTEHNGSIQIKEIPILHEEYIDGNRYARIALQLSLSLPCGYHKLSITHESTDTPHKKAICLIITAPDKCYLPSELKQGKKLWGLSCNLDNICSKTDWGIGNLTDLKTILTWGAENGAAALMVNPLNPMRLHPEYPLEEGQWLCRRFLSPIYLDSNIMSDFTENKDVQNVVCDLTFQICRPALRDQTDTDYFEVTEARMMILEKLWLHFQENHLDPETQRGRQFREFQQNGGEELWAWSVFASLSTHFKDKIPILDWMKWPTAYHDLHSKKIREFARQHEKQLAFHQYIQWQAWLQLEAIGRRSMELGLKIGLLATVAEPVGLGGFETWYRPELYAKNLHILCDDDSQDIAPSKPYIPVLPSQLRQMAYEPFITMLRANMKYAGGIRIDSLLLRENQTWKPIDTPGCRGVRLRYPVAETLAILALESQRNRCMVICENIQNLPNDFQETLIKKQVYLSRTGPFAFTKGKDRISTEDYPEQSMVAAGSDEISLDDFWFGKDIERHAEVHSKHHARQWEDKIIARAADRAQLLLALQREKLLPDEYDVNPVSVPVLTPALTRAVHIFLAKSAAGIFLFQLESIPDSSREATEEQIDPKLPPQQLKRPSDLEKILTDNSLSQLMETFCELRGIGVMKPSSLLTRRQKEKTATIPCSTYRLQLNANFTFSNVTDLIPYLNKLGISHCYTSPYLQARPGSSHGYDIIDHSTINTEYGSREDYEEFIGALGRHDMAQLFDMVPNHMGVGSDNQWWMDVLENGRFSLYADFFDINWQPQQEELKDRILLPVLGNHYGTELEDNRFRLEFIPFHGSFYIVYYEHRFPVAPTTYPFILGYDLQRLESLLGSQHQGLQELHNLINSLENLSRNRETDLEQLNVQHRNKEVLKRLLARLCREVPEISSFIKENVLIFNGRKNHPESYDLLHSLLSRQVYRLAFWKVASDEINYRRFFDINDLAGIRMEEPRVFEETHRLVLDLISTGKIDGMRIDHPDGLFDPGEYFQRLQKRIQGENPSSTKNGLPFYIIVEKILADYEHLQPDWLVHGTTGYDFTAQLNGLFIDSTSQKQLNAIYHRFIRESVNPDYQIYRCKKLIIKTAMAGELNVLAEEIHSLAKMNRHTQDFTFNGLREALIEIIALLPVYRTYIISDKIEKNERNFIEWTIAEAKKKQQTENKLIYDFIKSVLLMESHEGINNHNLDASLHFVMKLQQYTGPVMAKGVEDTFFYIYNRLLSLNEVGGDPRRYGVSVAAFHYANGERQKYWPHAMLNTSTHDSKRSEDVRARLNVISEIPREWQNILKKWSKTNRDLKTKIDGKLAPSKNDEYAFYQNLLGIWPFNEPDKSGRQELAERLSAAMLKSIKEAKIHTSWINRNQAYEDAMDSFVRGVLTDGRNFPTEFLPFHGKTAWFGMLNSLSQLLLKLTSPGVPDIYQGNEIWHFCLVDPDNRLPIDFDYREHLLREMQNFLSEQDNAHTTYLTEIIKHITDGRIKLYTTWRALLYRQCYPDIFEHGSYLPLQTKGSNKENLCAFMRSRAGKTIIVVVPRLCAGLLKQQEGQLPIGPEVWLDTKLILPENSPLQFRNIFTNELISGANDPIPSLAANAIFSSFPVALLEVSH